VCFAFLPLCDFCLLCTISGAIITGAFTFYRTQTGGFSVCYGLSGNTFYIKSSVCFLLTVYLLLSVFHLCTCLEHRMCIIFQTALVPYEWHLSRYPYSISLFYLLLCVKHTEDGLHCSVCL